MTIMITSVSVRSIAVCIAAVQPDVSSRREAVFHCIRGMFTVLAL